MMIEIVKNALKDSLTFTENLLRNDELIEKVTRAAELFVRTIEHGGKIYSCGNGGSMCDAMHFAEELSGNFRKKRLPLPALAISDPSYLTCTANDYGFEEVFARFIKGQSKKGDSLLAISTSGESANILRAASMAKELGVSLISLTGKKGSSLGKISAIDICTPTGLKFSDRVQELHIKIIHILIELIERQVFPNNYLE